MGSNENWINNKYFSEGIKEGKTQTLEKVKKDIRLLLFLCHSEECFREELNKLLSKLEDDEVKE
jgi:hypothetical protein